MNEKTSIPLHKCEGVTILRCGRIRRPFDDHSTNSRDESPAEGNGKEGNGKEGNGKEGDSTTRRRTTIAPSVKEVKAYCEERKNGIDAEQFVDHYTANGWKQSSGNPIKDWQAAVRTWERNGITRKPATTSKEDLGL
jgi:hypothetical protein